jgi:hypothetical protein
MTKFALTCGAAALALCALTGGAKAGGDLDDSYDNGYRRPTLSQLCYRHPEDPRCDPAPRYRPKPRPYYGDGGYGNGGGRCTATIRAAGKRHLFPGFARNSAILSWQREVLAVHGPAYSSWSRARRTSVSCGPGGGALTGCVATASPCRS